MKALIMTILIATSPLNVMAQQYIHDDMPTGSKRSHENMEPLNHVPNMKTSGDADKNFARTMADHHRSGIAIARIQVKDGKNKALVQMANKMIEQHEKEVKELEAYVQ